jgi:hypothetical protein
MSFKNQYKKLELKMPNIGCDESFSGYGNKCGLIGFEAGIQFATRTSHGETVRNLKLIVERQNEIIRSVLQGTLLDAAGNRDDDGMLTAFNFEDVVNEKRLDVWIKTLQKADVPLDEMFANQEKESPVDPLYPNRGKKWIDSDIKKISQLWDSGLTLDSMEVVFGRTAGALCAKLADVSQDDYDNIRNENVARGGEYGKDLTLPS